jgi:hypothetical protein
VTSRSLAAPRESHLQHGPGRGVATSAQRTQAPLGWAPGGVIVTASDDLDSVRSEWGVLRPASVE